VAVKSWVAVGDEASFPRGQVSIVEAGEVTLALCRDDAGTFYAVEDVCTHDGGPLGEGSLEGFAIECPRHGAQFDIRTGEVLQMPAVVPIRTFPVKLENGRVYVEVEE
jgi:3-phenylpropionate/trans-cinnamate dioxygenase ferredoxin subunit